MIGVILCGGKSSRMGDDKGLMLSGKKTWAQLAKEKLSELNINTVLSVNQNQFNGYQSIFSEQELVADNPELNIGGPLLGVLSVHSHFPNEDLLLLACDLPKMNAIVLKELMSHFVQKENEEAIVFKMKDHIEPLCGIYTKQGLAKIIALHSTNNLAKQSMKSALERLNTLYMTPKENWGNYFKNYNSPEDLNL
jgi:molybdenum cofactor guanylyltransferase